MRITFVVLGLYVTAYHKIAWLYTLFLCYSCIRTYEGYNYLFMNIINSIISSNLTINTNTVLLLLLSTILTISQLSACKCITAFQQQHKMHKIKSTVKKLN